MQITTEHLKNLKTEIEADLAAVNRLLTRAEREKSVAELVKATQPRMSTSQMAEDIIKTIGKDFRVQDICFELEKRSRKWSPYRSPTVSGVINKLRQRNPSEITVVEPGQGSRSGLYRYN